MSLFCSVSNSNSRSSCVVSAPPTASASGYGVSSRHATKPFCRVSAGPYTSWTIFSKSPACAFPTSKLIRNWITRYDRLSLSSLIAWRCRSAGRGLQVAGRDGVGGLVVARWRGLHDHEGAEHVVVLV